MDSRAHFLGAITLIDLMRYNRKVSRPIQIRRSVMGYAILCAAVFAATYALNLVYTSIFYHRGFTHRAIVLPPRTRRFVIRTGNWVTGLDPKTWSCMHRLHHLYADTKRDPHSPKHGGFFRLLLVQLWSYGDTMQGLKSKRMKYTNVVRDLKFPIHWLNLEGLWFLPHLLHLFIGIALVLLTGDKILGLAYVVGMLSHPFQGWMVNSFGHTYGYRNFKTSDRSTNHSVVAWLVFGEGYQNNHHYRPYEAKFSVRAGEFDFGYVVCKILSWFGVVQFPKPRLVRTYRKSA